MEELVSLIITIKIEDIFGIVDDRLADRWSFICFLQSKRFVHTCTWLHLKGCRLIDCF